MSASDVTAIAFIVAEVAVLWLLQRVVRAFGAYTAVLEKTQQQLAQERVTTQQLVKVVEYFDDLIQQERAS